MQAFCRRFGSAHVTLVCNWGQAHWTTWRSLDLFLHRKKNEHDIGHVVFLIHKEYLCDIGEELSSKWWGVFIPTSNHQRFLVGFFARTCKSRSSALEFRLTSRHPVFVLMLLVQAEERTWNDCSNFFDRRSDFCVIKKRSLSNSDGEHYTRVEPCRHRADIWDGTCHSLLHRFLKFWLTQRYDMYFSTFLALAETQTCMHLSVGFDR